MAERNEERMALLQPTKNYESRQTMHVPNTHVRKPPVRLAELFGTSTVLGSSRSRKTLVGASNPVRKPLHVEKTPNGPRLVRRNIAIGDKNFYPNTDKRPQQSKNVSKHQPRAYFQDMNATTAGISQLDMSPTVALVKLSQSTEKRVPRPQKPEYGISKARANNLRELAMQNSVVNVKKEAPVALNTNLNVKEVSIPNSPNIVLSSKKPLRYRTMGLPALQSNRLALKSSTITSSQSTAVQADLILPSAVHQSSGINNVSSVPQYSAIRQEKSVLNNVANIPFNRQTFALMQQKAAVVNAPILATGDHYATSNQSSANMKRLEVEMSNNYENQKQVQAELDILHKKLIELETNMYKLQSESRQMHNEFMEECRNIAQPQIIKKISPKIVPVDSVLQVDAAETDQNEISATPADVVPEHGPLIETVTQVTPLVATTQTLFQLDEKISINVDPINDVMEVDAATGTDPEEVPDHMPVTETLAAVVSFVPPHILVTSVTTPTRRSQRIAALTAMDSNQGQLADGNSIESISTAETVESFESLFITKEKPALTVHQSSSNNTSLLTPNTLKRNHTLMPSSNSTLAKKCRAKLSPSTSQKENVTVTADDNDISLKPSEFYGASTSLRRSNTFVIEKQADMGSNRKLAKNRRSVANYRQLQTSFRGMLQTPTQTPVSKSLKKMPPCAMDTPSNISRRVQASLELLLDSV